MAVVDVRHHKADYGFDGDYRVVPAPVVAGITGATIAALLTSAARNLVRGKPVVAAVSGITCASITATAAFFMHTTRVGKFEIWAGILDGLRLRGDETLLDLGCGRGAVLHAAAKLLPNGRAIGVDIVSSLVVHNISDRGGREKAISEAARVLRPGGRLTLVDIFFVRQYARQLRDLGWTEVSRRNLGWRMWWGPGLATHLITATKPARTGR